MRDRVSEFAEHVRKAATNKQSEKIVRYMIEDVAKDCPMHVLKQLGQCLVDCRRSEVRTEAEQN